MRLGFPKGAILEVQFYRLSRYLPGEEKLKARKGTLEREAYTGTKMPERVILGS
jgi:hypothetical protein